MLRMICVPQTFTEWDAISNAIEQTNDDATADIVLLFRDIGYRRTTELVDACPSTVILDKWIDVYITDVLMFYHHSTSYHALNGYVKPALDVSDATKRSRFLQTIADRIDLHHILFTYTKVMEANNDPELYMRTVATLLKLPNQKTMTFLTDKEGCLFRKQIQRLLQCGFICPTIPQFIEKAVHEVHPDNIIDAGHVDIEAAFVACGWTPLK